MSLTTASSRNMIDSQRKNFTATKQHSNSTSRVHLNRGVFIIASVAFLALCSFNCSKARSVDGLDSNKLRFITTNNPDVSIFSPHKQAQSHQRRLHSPVISELVAGISSALSAVGGDDQAILMVDTTTPIPASSTVDENEIDSENKCKEADCSDQLTDKINDENEEEDDCQGLFVTSSDDVDDKPPSVSLAAKHNMTDNEKLVALQTCLQKKVKRRLKNTARSSMELFDKLTLSGGCTSSLLNLVAGLSEVKSYAFKFLDASAKIPSGVMHGLLSDFGDFDQCLSIRSNSRVAPEFEVEEGAFSGKYCLLNIRLNYHAHVEPNSSVPEGIYEDGVLWDELVRNYWISNSTKGFQVGVCVPSRCSNDDMEQIYHLIAESYNVIGQVISCQDSNDLKRQTKPDLLQTIIIYIFASLIVLNFIGTIADRYWFLAIQLSESHCDKEEPIIYRILLCFSIQRNWTSFMRTQDASTTLAFNYDISLASNRQHEPVDLGCHFVGSIVGRRNDHLIAFTPINHLIETKSQLDNSSSLDESIKSLDVKRDDLVSNNGKNDRCHIAEQNNVERDTLQSLVQLLTVKTCNQSTSDHDGVQKDEHTSSNTIEDQSFPSPKDLLSHLTGIKLLVILWITIGHSFLYPSANNYQYYRSIIKMNITRDSVWFATTNFTLGIDMLLYMSGLVFAYKLAQIRNDISTRLSSNKQKSISLASQCISSDQCTRIAKEFIKKILRFWPTYLTVIALAIVIPLVGDGPMWPEMVSRRLGEACRKNWWANLLVINNFFAQTDVCLPSSWFISVLMQLFIIASLVWLLARSLSISLPWLMSLLLVQSIAASFTLAYYMDIKAPIIRMDESFVLELEDSIFRMYTNIFNNMGPFLVGIMGGLILVRWQVDQVCKTQASTAQEMTSVRTYNKGNGQLTMIASAEPNGRDHARGAMKKRTKNFCMQVALALLIGLISIAVLSSVFHTNYTRFWSATYWSLHRVAWAIVTGYIIHQCSTGRWRLLKDLFSLSHLIPFSRLIFTAYLVYPIFIHMHSGFVRDGLHVSIYNMLNIYVTRLVLTFALALSIHLFVELPFCSIEALLLNCWLSKRPSSATSSHPSLISKSATSSSQLVQATEKSRPLLEISGQTENN